MQEVTPIYNEMAKVFSPTTQYRRRFMIPKSRNENSHLERKSKLMDIEEKSLVLESSCSLTFMRTNFHRESGAASLSQWIFNGVDTGNARNFDRLISQK
jgi:hypothetical protein